MKRNSKKFLALFMAVVYVCYSNNSSACGRNAAMTDQDSEC